MIRGVLRDSVRIANCARFYGGVAIKTANRRGYRYGRALLRECREDRAVLDRRSLRKLNELLTYANANTDYYHEMFMSIGLVKDRKDPVAINNMDELRQIPLLDKETIRTQYESLCSRNARERQAYTYRSSGSTGEPVTVLLDGVFGERTSANFRLARRLMGIPFHACDCILLWAAERDIGVPAVVGSSLGVWFKNTIILNALRMTAEDMRNILHIANVKRPSYIRGYGQSLYELAKFADRESITVRPQNAVISTATVLSGEMRSLIQSVFGCEVFDYYGSREVGPIACECRAHDGLHILEDNNIVELVDDRGNGVKAGTVGDIVVTNLNNLSMPLLRYRIGDRAARHDKKEECPCGCNYSKLTHVVGRTNDMFVSKTGDKVDGLPLIVALFPYTSIERFQIIQKDYGVIEIVVQAKERLREDETRMIEAKLRESMGAGCIVRWRYTPLIEPGPTGKYRYVFSEVE